MQHARCTWRSLAANARNAHAAIPKEYLEHDHGAHLGGSFVLHQRLIAGRTIAWSERGLAGVIASRRSGRPVLCPPPLSRLLREHLADFAGEPADPLFRGMHGRPLATITYPVRHRGQRRLGIIQPLVRHRYLPVRGAAQKYLNRRRFIVVASAFPLRDNRSALIARTRLPLSGARSAAGFRWARNLSRRPAAVRFALASARGRSHRGSHPAMLAVPRAGRRTY